MSQPQYPNALILGDMLMEYRLDAVLGIGGFGITYLARDTQLEKDVAIKEYFPSGTVSRVADGSVTLTAPDMTVEYDIGLERFLKEARTLAGFSHPNIVRVNRYFKSNGTGYMVMDYEDGESLKAWLKRQPHPEEEILKGIMAPLLDGIEKVHATGFLHRDIKPDNIFVRKRGDPVLIDFGSARQSIGQTHTLTTLVTPGYAPFEQYSPAAEQGPYTDLYALGGVMFYAVTGENPPDAVRRMKSDPLEKVLAAAQSSGNYTPGLLNAIKWAMTLDETKRPQTVQEWREALLLRAPQTTTTIRTREVAAAGAVARAAPAPAAAPDLEVYSAPLTPASADTQDIGKLLERREMLDKAVKDKFQRVLAVMFTDLKGSTAMAEASGDIAVRGMLKQYHDLCETSIKAYNGTLVKTIGDGSLSHFVEATDACRAAADIQRGMEAINLSKRYPALLLARIGIHTGECLLEKNDVFGDVVNTASRFESSAHPGEILISEETYNALSDKAEFYSRFDREVTLKGKSMPFKAFIVFWDPKEIELDRARPVAKARPPTPAWKIAAWLGVPLVLLLAAAFYITGGGKFGGEETRSINYSVPK